MQIVTVAWFVNQAVVEIPPPFHLGNFIQEPLAASNRLEHYLQVCNKKLTTLVMHLLLYIYIDERNMIISLFVSRERIPKDQ